MKIAIYTIALNEEQFVTRWADCTDDADYRVVADTGSTDATVAKLRAIGVSTHDINIAPWRFDDARNAVLACVPEDADICLSLDMDEVLLPGWRRQLEAAWKPGTTRARFKYISTWDAPGVPRSFFFGRKCHARHGYRWRHAAHELMYPLPGVTEIVASAEGMTIHHMPDPTKLRSQYLDLMALAVAEEPADPRCALHHAYELMMHKKYAEAIAEYDRFLALPAAVVTAERSAALRYQGRCLVKLDRIAEARTAHQRACQEAPDLREPLFDFARFALAQKEWQAGISAVRQMLEITDMSYHHVRIAKAWGVGPYDVGSLCAYYAGERELAKEWLTKALELAPHDARLIKNGDWIFDKK